MLPDMVPSPNRRPGKLWASLQFPLIRMLIGFAAIALLAFPILILAHGLRLHGLAYAAVHVVSALIACGTYLVFVRFFERRTPAELALRELLPQFGTGFGVGAMLFCTTVAFLWFGGAYRISGVNPPMALLAPLVNALGAALLEELAVRGVLFRILEEWLGTWFALGLSALIFGLLHAVNPGANWRDVTGIALEGGGCSRRPTSMRASCGSA